MIIYQESRSMSFQNGECHSMLQQSSRYYPGISQVTCYVLPRSTPADTKILIRMDWKYNHYGPDQSLLQLREPIFWRKTFIPYCPKLKPDPTRAPNTTSHGQYPKIERASTVTPKPFPPLSYPETSDVSQSLHRAIAYK